MSNQEFWQGKIKIRENYYPRFMSAPVDGVSDSPFRQLVRDFSPNELLYTEMRHASLVANERTGISLRYNKVEMPMEYQISTHKTDFVEKAVEKVIAADFSSINLNCGCPAKTVIKSGCGSALMEDLKHLETLIKFFIKTIDGRKAFTVKIRAGFKKKNAFDVAQLAQDSGVDAIIIHPRTQPEGFASRLDYDLAAKIKSHLSIPLIFSGNITRFDIAQRVYDLTGCDGYMIGRALWGAPWKMKEFTEAAAGREFKSSVELALTYALKHLDLNIQFYGPNGFIPFKKQVSLYVRDIPQAAQWRMRLLRSQTEAEMRNVFSEIYKEQNLTIKT
ncbi:MAG: tRNA-dihydrouridine synthase [candidate division TM6 bacterium GW2011_GWF2_37_49]|nr:MAG: tRNA-dihydrouridine synthase [candidate division TM6 bacterium GW2011_GWF2_37_49]